ncbi:ankyrin [Cryphonectria parasitica EP155]|uniref:Ankyrin n=1 Tax=Cryphonectria parasitica (strain ATCC 38755 / EP155) TaxID=660469 RepID=A0A9P4Y989_CRYP1|nr:ankyrin [Cryphonectria parasitica EP155]KAF3768749.1 ankyrin [Cryphonectria parasitica EP155]
MLIAETAQFKQVFFVIDALDERLDHGHAYALLSTLSATKASVLITSRDIGSISEFLTETGAEMLEVSAQPDDLREYLNYRFTEPQAYEFSVIVRKVARLQADIVEALLSKALGMFLLPRMHMDLLIDTVKNYPTENTIRQTIKEIDKLPSGLQNTYDEYTARILRGQSAEHAKDVLAWVIYAKRPCPIRIIQEAISLQRHGNRIDDRIDANDLLKNCIGLLAEEVSSDKAVKFVHPDMERYFRSPDNNIKIQECLPQGEERIAISCLRCLLLDKSLELEDSILWPYAADHWAFHVQNSHMEHHYLTQDFLSQSEKVSAAMMHIISQPSIIPQFEYDPTLNKAEFATICQHKIRSICLGWHAAAFFGLLGYLQNATPEDIESRDENGWTPLWWAILGRHDAVVKFLLQRGANVDVRSCTQDMPLVIWMFRVQRVFMRDRTIENIIFIDRGSLIYHGNVHTLPLELSFPNLMRNLWWKTWWITNEATALNLINKIPREELNATDQDGNTVLMTVASFWDWKAVSRLLDRGADVSLKNDLGQSAFRRGLTERRQRLSVRDVILQDQRRVRIGDDLILPCSTTLDQFSFGIIEQTVETMLVRLVPEDLNMDRAGCEEAFRLAIIYHHTRIVHELLELGADPNMIFWEDGLTPLGAACTPMTHIVFKVKNAIVTDQTVLDVGMSMVKEDKSAESYHERLTLIKLARVD